MKLGSYMGQQQQILGEVSHLDAISAARAKQAVTGFMHFQKIREKLLGSIDNTFLRITDLKAQGAAHQTALNLIGSLQMYELQWHAQGRNDFQRKPFFRFLYRHRHYVDLLALVQGRTEWKQWDLKNFRPESKWTVQPKGTGVVAMFKKVDDLVMFKMQVV